MFKLIEALLGVLLFLLLGGLLIVKNQEDHYAFETALPHELPPLFLAEEFKNDSLAQSLEFFFPWKLNTIQFQSSHNELNTILSIEDEYYGSHTVKIELDPLEHIASVKVEGRKNVLLRVFWMFNGFKIKESRRKLSAFLKQKLTKAELKFNEHRIQWEGIQVSDPIYYLALEKSWDTIPDQKTLLLAHKELLDFARNKQIPAQGNIFTVYPYSSKKKIWRFAYPVNRYYSTGSNTIKCRRFKGGTYLSITHKGTNKHIEKSWQQLQDSLTKGGYSLAYPPIERYPINSVNEFNPFKWETELILAVKK